MPRPDHLDSARLLLEHLESAQVAARVDGELRMVPRDGAGPAGQSEITQAILGHLISAVEELEGRRRAAG